MRHTKLSILSAVFLVFLFCGISGAELVEHAGLPNEEGVKPNPLDPKLSNPALPNRTGYEVEPITMHAAFTTQVQFDTNVFLEDKDEKFDVITTLNPSVGLDLPVGDNYFAVDYDFAAYIFGVHDDHSYVDHRVRGVGVINWTDYQINIADVYRYFSDRAGSEDTNRVKRQNNYLRAGLAATGFEQLDFEAGYTFGVENFISGDTLYTAPNGETLTYHDKNRLINVFDLLASYRFLPKTSLLVESYVGWLTYDSSKSSNSWFTESMVGLRGDLSEDFTSDLKAGIRYQQYDSSDLTDSNNFIGPVITGTVTYKRTKNDIFDLRLERSIYESTFYNMNYYNINHAGLRYTHFFNNKISGDLFGYYQLNLYPSQATVDGVTDKRYDHLFGGGIGVRYDVKKWLSVEADYEYRQRESRFSTFDYIDNLFTIRGTIGF